MNKYFILPILLITFAVSGCYTKFYKPGMERYDSSYGQLYNRYDSTAIDTTLTAGDWKGENEYPNRDDYYTNNNDRWNYWGRPRGQTRWGFDFDNFYPGYYWSYYGYYDYYSTPWWSSPWYDPWSPWYGGGGDGTPVEPPSQRDYGRREHQGGSSINPLPGGGTYAPPASQNPPAPTTPTSKDPKQDDGKRDGRRGR